MFDNRKSVTVQYDEDGNGICIIIFKRGTSRTYRYTDAVRIDRLYNVVCGLEWECDHRPTENYFYMVA